MVEDIKQSNKKEAKKMTVQEVIKEQKKGNPVDTATPETTYEEREKIEKEVTMVRVGRDPAGRWRWVKSNKLTAEDKKSRADMVEKIRKGERV